MYCSQCGSTNPDDGRFCTACGKTLSSPSKGRTVTGPLDIAPTEMGFMPDTLLMGRYRIRRELGVGGMGRVYMGVDERLNSMPVAIKVLRDLLNRDASSIKRLAREAELSMRLSHPNVIRIHNFEDDGSVRFLVMEYVDGETLRDVIAARDRLDESETRRIGIEICRGLEHAHEKGIIHRDLKPGNILIGRNGSIKIADFGIARACRDSMSRLTSMQDSGTLLYMSPEQLDGDSSVASDIYSLGCVLYEMLSGDPPFKSGDITGQIRSKPPKPLTDVGGPMNALILRCLQKQPADRIQTVREVRKELENGRQSAQAAREAEEAQKRAEAERRADEERRRTEEQSRLAQEARRQAELQLLEEERRRREAKQPEPVKAQASRSMESLPQAGVGAPAANAQADSVFLNYRKVRIGAYCGVFVLGLILSEFSRSFQSFYGYGNESFMILSMGWLAGSLAFGPLCDVFGFRRLFLSCGILSGALLLMRVFLGSGTPAHLMLLSIVWGASGAIRGGLYTLVNDISPGRRVSALSLLAAFDSCGVLASFALWNVGHRIVLAAWTVAALASIPFCARAGFPKPKHPGGIAWRQAASTLGKPLFFAISVILLPEAAIRSWLPLDPTILLGAGMATGRLAASRIGKRVPPLLLVVFSASIAAGGVTFWRESGRLGIWVAIMGFGLGAILPSLLAQAGGTFSAFSGTAFALLFTMNALAARELASYFNPDKAAVILAAMAVLALVTHVLLRRRIKSSSETGQHQTVSHSEGSP